MRIPNSWDSRIFFVSFYLLTLMLKHNVLDLCNNLEISENEIVKITPIKKPEYHVILPSRTFVSQEFNKTENIEFENKILKTTYGNIEKE